MSEPSIFDAYNARFLAPEQVGKNFIYSATFDQVVLSQNSLLIGPRGSGKTTLLKMLTVPGLYNWKHNKKKVLLKHVDYTGIYVPSDFTWYPDLRRPINAAPDKHIDEFLGYALFRAHVLLAVCETIQRGTEPSLDKDDRFRRFFIKQGTPQFNTFLIRLADAWRLEPKYRGLYGLKEAVSEQIRAIQQLITISCIESIPPRTFIKKHQKLAASVFDDLVSLANAFDDTFQRRQRWAVLFDELEIAPSNIKTQILQSPRSFDQRFLVKCSASPFDQEFSRILGPRMPMRGQDFTQVFLSQSHQRDTNRFSQELFSALSREYGISAKPSKILGSSFFDDSFSADEVAGQLTFETANAPSNSNGESESSPSEYAPGGYYHRKFSSLARKDSSFKEYLARRGVDIDQMATLPETLKAADVRKIISSVTVRDEFLFELNPSSRETKQTRRRLRSRKRVSEIYTGARAVFAICEGNPRWLIGFLRPMIALYKAGRTVEKSGIVIRAEQAKRIEVMTTQFLSLLSTITPGYDSGSSAFTALGIVEHVGQAFFEEVVGGEFNPEPVLSFRVDDAVEASLENAVGQAMNQGAFVLLHGSRQPTVLGDIKGQRVRLSHLLAPLFSLPLVTGRAVNLSSLVRQREENPERPLLLDLFEDRT